MASSDYRAFLKTLIAEVVDEKIMKRIEKCESDVHDLAGRVRALESSSKENDDLVNGITNLEKRLMILNSTVVETAYEYLGFLKN